MCYCINRSPSITLEFKTPEELWVGRPTDCEILRVFRCVAYMHKKMNKLESRAIKCMFFGYPDGVKGYKLLDYEHSKCVISEM